MEALVDLAFRETIYGSIGLAFVLAIITKSIFKNHQRVEYLTGFIAVVTFLISIFLISPYLELKNKKSFEDEVREITTQYPWVLVFDQSSHIGITELAPTFVSNMEIPSDYIRLVTVDPEPFNGLDYQILEYRYGEDPSAEFVAIDCDDRTASYSVVGEDNNLSWDQSRWNVKMNEREQYIFCEFDWVALLKQRIEYETSQITDDQEKLRLGSMMERAFLFTRLSELEYKNLPFNKQIKKNFFEKYKSD
jgi:hypothetical protein